MAVEHVVFVASVIIGSHYMLGRVKGRVGARPRVEADLRSSGSRGQSSAIFWNSVSVVNSSKKLPNVRQDVEALKEMPIPSCMCEPVVTAQSLGDETHAVVTRPQWAGEHGQHTWCGPLCRWVENLAPR